MNKAGNSIQHTFSVHIIWMSGSTTNPAIRVIWVSNCRFRAVYEGVMYWSACIHWISYLSYIYDQSYDFARFWKLFEKNRFVTIRNIKVSTRYIESLGFQRADG